MKPATDLEIICALLAASADATDHETEIIYVALAKAKLASLSRDVADLDRLVKAREVEFGRLSKESR